MSRKLTVILLAMMILVGAMSLKTAVTSHNDNGAVMMANGGAPVPPPLYRNGGAPVPPPLRNGGAPVPPPLR